MKKIILLLALASFAWCSMNAQTREFTNIKNYRPSSVGPILELDRLVGYYSFFKMDKADKKNSMFNLTIMDDNLSTVKSLDILRPSADKLIETVFNGESFVCSFYNYKKVFEFVCFDKTGKQVGTYKDEDPSKWEIYRVQAIVNSTNDEEEANATILPLGNKGFVRQSFTKNDKLGYTFEGFDNNMKSLWKTGSSDKSDMVETADIVTTSDNYVSAMVSRKKNLMTKKQDMFFQFIDAKTGKLVFEREMKDKNEMSIINVFVDEAKSDIVIFGEYYPIGEEMMKSKSEGVFVLNLDLNGKELALKKFDWIKDMNKILKTEDATMLDVKDAVRTYFHKIYRTQNGHIIAIGEQFKKGASAAGIAMRMMGGTASTVQLNIMNMVTVDLNPDLTLAGFTAYKKRESPCFLPQGAGGLSSTMLAMYVKQMGGFDYSFTSSDPKRDRYVTLYTDMNKKDEEGKKSDVMFGVIKYEDGKISSQRIPFSTDATSFRIEPAKNGYIAIREFYKKKKMFTYRLEKIVY